MSGTTKARTAHASTVIMWTAHARLASEDIQPVLCGQHGIVGNGVVFRISTLHGVDRAAEGGLLMKDVVELE